LEANEKMKQLVGLGSLIGAMIAIAPAAHASLVLQSLVPLTGTGIGSEPTILTITSQANATTESGCVSFSNLGSTGFTAAPTGACTGSTGDVQQGASQTSIQQLSAIGSGAGIDATNFAVVFNAAQPSGGPITLTSLTAAFYNSTGTLLFQTGAVSCPQLIGGCNFLSTVTGVGGAGYLFKLDPTQQALATAAGAFSSQNNYVGLSASASNATGGPETFFLARVTAIPEPTTLLLMGGGLIGLAFARKSRPSR
jgi:hypothetical protein